MGRPPLNAAAPKRPEATDWRTRSAGTPRNPENTTAYVMSRMPAIEPPTRTPKRAFLVRRFIPNNHVRYSRTSENRECESHLIFGNDLQRSIWRDSHRFQPPHYSS